MDIRLLCMYLWRQKEMKRPSSGFGTITVRLGSLLALLASNQRRLLASKRTLEIADGMRRSEDEPSCLGTLLRLGHSSMCIPWRLLLIYEYPAASRVRGWWLFGCMWLPPTVSTDILLVDCRRPSLSSLCWLIIVDQSSPWPFVAWVTAGRFHEPLIGWLPS